jgi:hypothetical protein
VRGGVKGLDKSRASLLELDEGLCLCEGGIGQPQLNLELAFDEVLPWLARVSRHRLLLRI